MSENDELIFGEKNPLPEFGFYYPGPMWKDDKTIKNLILFFDGIALLVPTHLKGKHRREDPAIAIPLEDAGLLRIFEPETFVNKEVAVALAEAMTEVIAAGLLDNIKRSDDYHALSWSRMGLHAEPELARMIYDELKTRRLASDREDGVNIEINPIVRNLILALLAQILQLQGKKHHILLSPMTDRPSLITELTQLLEFTRTPSTGHVVQFDMETIGVDLSGVPMDEVLHFRSQYYKEYRRYMYTTRKFVNELSIMPAEERLLAFQIRQEEITELAHDIRRLGRRVWNKPAYMAISLFGAAFNFVTSNPISALLGLATDSIGIPSISNTSRLNVYSYLFRAERQLGN